MASKKCIICNCSLTGRRDAKTCSVRCRKRLQIVRHSFGLQATSSNVSQKPASRLSRPLAKTLLVLILGIAGALSIFFSLAAPKANAAASSYLNFQMRLLTSSGSVVNDGNYNVEFKIYDSANSTGSAQGSCSGDSSCKWVETYTGGNQVRVVNGYMSVKLGSLTSFSGINWDQQTWLGVRIGGTGAPSWEAIELTSDGTATGNKIQLTGVPLAFTANQLATGTGSSRGTLAFSSLGQATSITLPDPGAGTATVCYQNASACGFAASSGSGAYIQNGTSLQNSANFNIQSAATNSIGGIIRGASGQTADLLQIQHGASGTSVLTVGKDGEFLSKVKIDSTTAFQVQNAAGNTILNISTLTGVVLQKTFGATYLGGADTSTTANSGNLTSTFNASFTVGKYLYVAKNNNGTDCAGVSGNFNGCELQVYDVTQAGNPKYIGGADYSGSTNSGTGATKSFISISVAGHYAYITQTGSAGTCSATPGSADGCELKIFDISNPAAPAYVGGADASGSANSGSGNANFLSISVSGRYAYVTQQGDSSAACSQTAGSAIGCELKIFDISNPAAPTYISGKDADGSSTGSISDDFNSIFASGRYAYVAQSGDSSAACSQTTPAIGCELKIFDISNPASPSYVGGLDSDGTNSGSTAINMNSVYVSGRYAYIAKNSDASSSSCSTPAHCELQIIDISNPSSPTFTGGGDSDGNTNSGTGTGQLTSVYISGKYAYTTSGSSGSACSASVGSAIGCELKIWDVSSPSAPIYSGGGDMSGTTNSGTELTGSNKSVTVSGRNIYISRSGGGVDCSSATGCELQVWDASGVEATSVLANSLEAGTLQVNQNGLISGDLNIQGSLSIGQSTNLNGDLSANGKALYRNQSDSSTAFQIQNATGGSLLNIDTTNSNIILNGLNTGALQSWTAANTLPAARYGNSVVAANGYMYSIAGADSSNTATNSVYYAKINADGSVGTWGTTTSTNLPTRYLGGALVLNGFMYYFGGTTNSTNGNNNVSYAKINPDGTLSSWTTTTSFGVGKFVFGYTSYKNYIYLLGGINSSGSVTSVLYYGKQNPDGSITSWTAASGNSIGYPSRAYQSVTAANGYIYSLGGLTAASNPNFNSDWVYAPINGDGSYGTFTSTNPTGAPVIGQAAPLQISNGSVYVVNGSTGFAALSAVSYAQLNSNGTTGSWSTQSNPAGLTSSYSGAGTVYNGYFYNVGGYNGSYLNNVEYTSASRVKIGGSIDLVGSAGGLTLSDGNGASLTAGNTNIVGNLQVMGSTSLSGNLSVNGYLNVNDSAYFQNSVDSTTAFQIQNATGGNLFVADTSNINLTLLGGNVGATSAWTDQSSNKPSAINLATSVGYNGFLYILGGLNSGGTAQDTVQYSKLNTDGSTGAWTNQATNKLPAVRYAASSAVANGYVYVLGGINSGGTVQDTVYYAKLNADGSTGAWTDQTSNKLSAPRRSATTVIANGYLYVIGGLTTGGTKQDTILYAKLNADGSTGAWTNQASNKLPTVLSSHTSVVANGYIYAFGGSGPTTTLDTVYYAKLNADGSTGAWTNQASNKLPAVRSGSVSVVSNGYAYVIGGWNTAAQDTVFYAKLNADGSTGAWTNQASNKLPAVRSGSVSVVSNGYAYVIGGWNTAAQDTVFYAKLNADGSTGAWTNQASNKLPAIRESSTTAVVNGYIYVLGGDNVSTTFDNVYYASTSRVQLNGTLDLVGLQGQYLAEDGGGTDAGSSGGSITAGNITAVGNLQVQGTANFVQSISVLGNLTNNGSALFQNSTNTTTAFQIQNSSYTQLLNADTTNMRLGIDVTYSAISAPTQNASSTSTTGGTLSAATYYYKITAVDSAGGETTASNERNQPTTGSTSTVTLSWVPVSGASGYKIYRSTTTNTEVYLTSTLGIVNGANLNYIDTGSALAGSANPPSTGTAYTSTNNSNNKLQLTVGGLGVPTGQVYVSGTQASLVASTPLLSWSAGYTPGGVIVNNYAYIEDVQNNILGIYDISKPQSPVGLSSTVINGGAIAVIGKYAYIGRDPNIKIYDVSNPYSPSLSNTVNLLTTGVQVKRLEIKGNFLYLITTTTLQIFDITNPTTPVPKSVLNFPTGLQDISVQGKYAYIAASAAPFFNVVDISNSTNPILTSTLSPSGSPQYYNIVAQGRYAYVKNGNNGITFQIIDISNPSAPARISSLVDNINCNGAICVDISIQGRYAYVGGNGGGSGYIEIIDISNPYTPSLTNSVSTTAGTLQIGVQGRYLYQTSTVTRNLEVYDLGGAYVQQLESGGIETSTLNVEQDANFGSATIQRALNVGQNAQVAGNAGIGGGLNVQGSTLLSGGINQLATPIAPTVTPQGTTGAQRWDYTITAVNAFGGETIASTAGTTSTGNATLSATNFNRITWSAVSGASAYKIYRTYVTGATSPTTTGLIASTSSTTFDDSGYTANSSTSPTLNTTAQFTVLGASLYKNSTDSTSALQIQNSSGTQLLTADTTNMRLGVDVTYTAMSAPTQNATSTSTTGGSLAAATYYYKITALDNAGGETTASNERNQLTTGSASTITLSWVPVTGASGYKIYRNTSTNTEVLLVSTLGTVNGANLNYVDIGSITPGSATPPSSNTANTSTHNSNNALQLSVGGMGTPSGQLYVSGSAPSSYISTIDVSGACVSKIQGNYIYTAGSSGQLKIYDYTNPVSPVLISSTATNANPLGCPSMQVVGNNLFLGSYAGGTQIFDISNPSSPSVVTNIAAMTQAKLIVQGHYLYVSQAANHLNIYDIANISSPKLIYTTPITNTVRDIMINGNYLYVTIAGDLKIYNITNPALPSLVSTTALDTAAIYKMIVVGRYLYVITSSLGTVFSFQVFDISNPASLTLTGKKSGITVNTQNMEIVGHTAYTSTIPSATMNVIDFTNPAQPNIISTISVNGAVSATNGRFLYTLGTALQAYDVGGAYISSVDTGIVNTNSLTASATANFLGAANFANGLQATGFVNLYGNTGIGGGLTVQGTTNLSGTANVLAVPGTPTVTPQGTTGSTSYSYTVTAVNAYGGETTASAAGSTTTGNATLSVSNFNRVTWSSVSGASGYKIYRTASAGTPSNTGFVSTATSTTFDDTGLNANSTASPTINTTAQLSLQGAALFQNTTNSSSALQVNNAGGSRAIGVDTTTNNLITNSNIEQSINGNWAAKGGGSVSQTSTQAYLGSNSLSVTTAGAADEGTKQTLASTLTASTTYYISWFDKLNSGSFTDVLAAYSYNGSSESACTGQNDSTVVTAGWRRHTCQFTTGSGGTAPTASNYIVIKQSALATRTFYIDAVMLVASSNLNVQYRETAIQLDGLITSPINLQPTTDSTSAFSISNSSGSSTVLSVSTTDGNVCVGCKIGSFQLDVVGQGRATTSFVSPVFDSVSGALAIGNGNATAINLGKTASNIQTTVNGTALFKPTSGNDSTTAFQVQNAAGTSTLFNINTTNSIISFSGTTSTFVNVTFSEAHIKSAQTTAPTIGTPINCGSGTPTSAVTAGSTDSAGSFDITNNGSNGTSCDTVITFNKAYGTAPKSVLVVAKNTDGSLRNVYVSSTSTTTFTVMFGTNPITNPTTFSFYYWIIE